MLGEFYLVSALFSDNSILKYIGFALIIIEVVGKWSVLAKASRPGWSQFIPIWGDLVFLEVGELPWWWIIGLELPIIIGLCIARNFDKGVLFGLGLAFFPLHLLPYSGLQRRRMGRPRRQHDGVLMGLWKASGLLAAGCKPTAGRPAAKHPPGAAAANSRLLLAAPHLRRISVWWP